MASEIPEKPRLLTIVGSPRKGNSYTLARIFRAMADQLGWATEAIFIPSLDLRGCRGCYQFCTTQSGTDCVHKDDMDVVIPKMVHADLTLFAAPLYNGGYPAVMTGFLERCLPLWEGHQTEQTLVCDRVMTRGRRAVLAIVQEEETIGAADLAFEVFDHTVGHIYGYDVIDRINMRGLKAAGDLMRNQTTAAAVARRAKSILDEAVKDSGAA